MCIAEVSKELFRDLHMIPKSFLKLGISQWPVKGPKKTETWEVNYWNENGISYIWLTSDFKK